MYSEQKEELNEQKCTLVVKITKFSNESMHKPGQEAAFNDISVDNRYFEEELFLDVYANGINSECENYITIAFSSKKPLLAPYYNYFELYFVVGAIDVSKNKRFSRSYVFPYNTDWRTEVKNPYVTFTVGKFLSRETLLRESFDLLPQDCLTLQFDIHIKTIAWNDSKVPVEALVQNSFAREESSDYEQYFLHLDSVLAENLINESSFFQKMASTPMIEKETRYMNVPTEEYPYLRAVCFILMGKKSITVNCIRDICEMYITADKYDIPVVIENCRRLLISFLLIKNNKVVEEHVSESIDLLLELSEMYNDARLKKIVEKLSISKGIDNEDVNQILDDDELESNWKLELSGKEPLLYFTFSIDTSPSRPEYDFYS